MKVIIIDHARERIQERGATEEEVRETLSKGKELKAAGKRTVKEMVFPFNARWQGRFYPRKKLRVIYAEQGDDLVVITVYTYFGKWEESE
ncbi:MAG: DUF4258 domain-containing protein [Dehalococcoidia bacterium]|nr:DUF4258 domain-containing protein [Dehalococcoidia bacterium]